MSHADDGTLHAYLDGGLSAMDAVRVERHLAECAPCRARLEEARGLVQRAARLLEWATPPERAAPPLADLPPHTVPPWRAPVAWAATIVIALGIGIYGGQKLLTRDSGSDVALKAGSERRSAAPARTPAPVETEPDRDVAAPTPAVIEPLAVAPEAKRESVTTSLARAQTLTDSVARVKADSVRQLATQVALNASPAAQGERDAGRRGETIPDVTQRLPIPAPAAPPRMEPAQLAARTDDSRVRTLAASTTWTVISRDSAALLLGSPIVALPDVPINAVRASRDAVVVEHVVPPGQVIRLIERRASVEQQQAGNAIAGTATELLARYVGGLRVEISGPMPPDSLSRLLEKVRPVP